MMLPEVRDKCQFIIYRNSIFQNIRIFRLFPKPRSPVTWRGKMTSAHTVSCIFQSYRNVFFMMGNKHACSFSQVDTLSLSSLAALRNLPFGLGDTLSTLKYCYLCKYVEMIIYYKNSQCYAHKISKNWRDIGRTVLYLSPTPALCFTWPRHLAHFFYAFSTLLATLIHLTSKSCYSLFKLSPVALT